MTVVGIDLKSPEGTFFKKIKLIRYLLKYFQKRLKLLAKVLGLREW